MGSQTAWIYPPPSARIQMSYSQKSAKQKPTRNRQYQKDNEKVEFSLFDQSYELFTGGALYKEVNV